MWQLEKSLLVIALASAFFAKGQGNDDLLDSRVNGAEPCQLRMVLQVTGHWGGTVFIEKGTIPFNILLVNDTYRQTAKSTQSQAGIEMNEKMKEWILNPVFHFYQMTSEKGEWVKGRGLTSIEMGVLPLWKTRTFPNVLTNSVQIYGSFGKEVVETLGSGTYALEAYYDTGLVTNMNVKYNGVQKSTRGLFTIKHPTTIHENMHLDRQDILESIACKDWDAVLQKVDDAFKKYPEKDAAEFFISRGRAYREMGKLKEAVDAFERYLHYRWETRGVSETPVTIRAQINELRHEMGVKEPLAPKKK